MQAAFAHNAAQGIQEPIIPADLAKSILVPRPDFEAWLARHDWTYHQIARGEFPSPYAALSDFQLGCLCSDALLWATAFLREPDDPDHDEPYDFWEYQKESLCYTGSCVHKDGSEVGKTREIIPWVLHKAFTVISGSGLIGAPLQTHLDEIIESMYDQLLWNKGLGLSLRRWKKHPHHAFYFTNGFKIDFRPSGHDGISYRGVHASVFAIKDEAAKDKNPKQWSEFWRAMKPGCVARIYSVPDGDRSCEFYRLAQRAKRSLQAVKPANRQAAATGREEESLESLHDVPAHIKALTFRLFHWPKTLMPYPFWSPERKRFYIEQYGGEDSPGYKHNVLGEDGDPESTVFPWHQFRLCIKDIPEYRCLKLLVDGANNEVIVNGYRCEFAESAGTFLPDEASEQVCPRSELAGEPVPRAVTLIDTVYRQSTFFDPDSDGESPFRALIKGFFNHVPGLKRGGGDFGFSGDPTELVIKLIHGKRERIVARLHLKHVTYDQQCQALDALDDLYNGFGSSLPSPVSPLPSDLTWGTDFGNAGSAVAHDLQGLPQYAHKQYDDRLRGFQFQSTTDNVDESGGAIIDARTGKPAKITLKELATDIMVKKMQRQELEYPADPDFAFFYPNHTVRQGDRQRIYKKEDDHLIDADRVQILAHILSQAMEDLFA